MNDTDDFISHRELSTQELETALLIEKGTIEAYAGNLPKSMEFWKAVENKVRIEAELRKVKAEQ
jgi:hypothetical protein